MLALGLSAPWYTYRNKIASIFHGDDEVEVSELLPSGSGNYKVNVTIDNAEKACALSQLLRTTIKFGNVTLKINVQVPNKAEIKDDIDLVAAFEGNPNISIIRRIRDVFGTTWTYVMFEKSSGVVQFYNDNLQDPYGNYVGLISEIANEVFIEQANVCYSIDI